jgi:serine/threonine-protein kinase
MNEERWRRIEQIYHAALELPENERSVFLTTACQDDVELLHEIESLLAESGETDHLLSQPLFSAALNLIWSRQPDERLKDLKQLGFFKIIELIGRGGMGDVYLAEDTRLQRLVALKILSFHLISSTETILRFHYEARAASAISHPNVAHIYEVGHQDDFHFIAMEYVRGVTLREILKTRQTSTQETLEILIQTVTALSASHKKGIIHRDIKPENIMVSEEDHVKVLDFGLAKLVDADGRESNGENKTKDSYSTEPGLVMGTSHYMSPEQVRGLSLDVRTDIWSAGIVLFEMLTGQRPFRGETSSDVRAAILRDPAPKLIKLRPDLTGSKIIEIVERCLAKNAEDRYVSSKALLAELKSAHGEFTDKRKSGSDEDSSSRFSVPNLPGHEKSFFTGGFQTLQSYFRRVNSTRLAGILLFVSLITGGIWYWLHKYALVQGEKPTSINLTTVKVLPPEFIENHDPNLDYLADGLKDCLVSRLIRFDGLQVYRSKPGSESPDEYYPSQTVDENSPNTAFLLSGKIKKDQDQITFIASLKEPDEEMIVWEHDYKIPFTKIDDTLLELSRLVAADLSGRFGLRQQEKKFRDYRASIEAYNFYTLAGNFISKQSYEDFNSAVRYYEKAIEVDPSFAPAYAGLATAYSSYTNFIKMPVRESIEKAREYARKALEIDPELSETHFTMAGIYFRVDWNYVDAEKEYVRAIELGPEKSAFRAGYANFLTLMKRYASALKQIKFALLLDPTSVSNNNNLGRLYFFDRQFDKAIEQFRKTVELGPNSANAYFWLYTTFATTRQDQKASEVFTKVVAVLKTTAKPDDPLINRYSKINTKMGWRRIESDLIKHVFLPDPLTKVKDPFFIAEAYAQLDDRENALYWLEQAVTERDPEVVKVYADPRWDKIRDDSRFQRLLERMNFPKSE